MKWALLVIIGYVYEPQSATSIPGYATKEACDRAAATVNTRVSNAHPGENVKAHCIPGPG